MLQETKHLSLRQKKPQAPPAPLASTTVPDRIFGAATLVKILPINSVTRIDYLSVRPLSVVRSPSGKWLVGPNSARNLAASFFISLGNTGRCYGMYCAATDEPGQRRARY
jgi:hypothetical protein